MNLKSLLLGKYNKDQSFNLYCIEDSTTLLFKATDISYLFNLPLSLLETSESYKYKTDVYLTTTELTQIAIKHNKFLLAELCKLNQNDYMAHLDQSILTNLAQLEYLKSKKNSYISTHIQVQENRVKSEPITPPPIASSSSDPMSVNSLLIGAGSQAQKNNNNRRLSRVLVEDLPNKKQKNSTEQFTSILPKPIHTVNSQKSNTSTLLSKRLGNLNNTNKNTRNLTIYAPSYGEQFNSIQSAPIHSNFRTKTTQPHPLSQATMISPAVSSTTSEFAIPPIVPSQQQPHTAHPSSIHRPQPSPQYPYFPKTPGLQRQQFLQPFEHLFDTIETTRTLKGTLDDQIRRSSSLIQTLQASSSTIENLVRSQIKEVQKEIFQSTESTLDSLLHRISKLEKKLNEESPKTARLDLVNPPTIVRSQQDIGPNEYFKLLDTFRERLDKLEKQLES